MDINEILEKINKAKQNEVEKLSLFYDTPYIPSTLFELIKLKQL